MSLGFKFTTFKSTANLQVSNHIWNALKRKDERKSFPTFNVSWMQIENRMKLFRHFWLRENLPVSPQSMSRVTLHFAVKYICLPLSLFLSFFLNSFLSLFLIPTSYTLSKKVKACTNYYKPFLFLLDFPQRALCLCTEAFNCSNTNSFPPCSPSIHYLDLFYQMRPHTIPLCSLLMLSSIILPSSNHWPVTKGPKSNILTIYYTTPVGKVIFCWSQWPKMRSYTRTRSMPPIRSKRLSILQ